MCGPLILPHNVVHTLNAQRTLPASPTGFVNPLRLLTIDRGGAFDPSALRRAARRVQLEFEAGNGVLEYEGYTVTLAQMRPWLEVLETEEAFRALQLVEELPGLSDFLTTGDAMRLAGLRQLGSAESAALRRVAGSQYAVAFTYALSRALREDDPFTITLLFRLPELWGPDGARRVESVVDDHLARLRNALDLIRTAIDEGEEDSVDVDASLTEDQIKTIAALPRRFDSARGSLGTALNRLAMTVFNDLDDAETAAVLLARTTNLPMSESVTVHVNKQRTSLEKIVAERRLAERYSGPIAHWGTVVEKLQRWETQVESCTEEEVVPLAEMAITAVDVAVLNALPAELETLRNSVAGVLRSMSVEIWNTHSDSDTALAVLRHAGTISVTGDVRQRLLDDRNQLQELAAASTASAHKLVVSANGYMAELSAAYATLKKDSVAWPVVIERTMLVLGDDSVRESTVKLAKTHPTITMELCQTLATIVAEIEFRSGTLARQFSGAVVEWEKVSSHFATTRSQQLQQLKTDQQNAGLRSCLVWIAVFAFIVYLAS